MNKSTVNSTTIVDLEAQSLTILGSDIPAQIFRLILCVIGLVTNFLVVLIIAWAKELHTKFLLHVAFLSVADLLLCLFTCARSSHTIQMYINAIPGVTTALECMLRLSWVFYAADVSRLMNLLMCLDRMCAVCTPALYHNLPTKQVVFGGVSLAFGVSLFLPVEEIAQATEKSTLIPACDITYATSWFFLNVWQTARSVITWIVFLVCIATIVMLAWRLKRAQNSAKSIKQLKRELEPKAIKAIAVHCTVYLLTWLAASLGTPIVSGSTLPSETKIFYVSMFQAISLLSSSLNLFIYLSMLNLFRKHFLRMFPCAKMSTQIEPHSTTDNHNKGHVNMYALSQIPTHVA